MVHTKAESKNLFLWAVTVPFSLLGTIPPEIRGGKGGWLLPSPSSPPPPPPPFYSPKGQAQVNSGTEVFNRLPPPAPLPEAMSAETCFCSVPPPSHGSLTVLKQMKHQGTKGTHWRLLDGSHGWHRYTHTRQFALCVDRSHWQTRLVWSVGLQSCS